MSYAWAHEPNQQEIWHIVKWLLDMAAGGKIQISQEKEDLASNWTSPRPVPSGDIKGL